MQGQRHGSFRASNGGELSGRRWEDLTGHQWGEQQTPYGGETLAIDKRFGLGITSVKRILCDNKARRKDKR